MSDYTIVCEGMEISPHEQIRITGLKDGVLKERGKGRAKFDESSGTWSLRCHMCRLAVRLSPQDIHHIASIVAEHPELTTDTKPPERFQRDDLWPAVTIRTLRRMMMRGARVQWMAGK